MTGEWGDAWGDSYWGGHQPHNGRWDDPNMTWDEFDAFWDQGAGDGTVTGGTSVIYLNPSDPRVPPRKGRRDLYWN